MNFSDPISQLDLASDAGLVAASLGGDQAAFAQIVARYQRLLCSLAYSATGQLSQSEDLTQETFIEAWRKMDRLREPDKLRAWLCGILRFKISRLRRSDGTQPVRHAEPLDEALEIASFDVPAQDITIHKEEQALLWSALERVPELYREPLVLYYREHQSVEHVAAALELSEDTVKQRLSRGRKILQEQVLSFVERALAQTTPGKLFTLAVISALPPLSPRAKAAGLTATVAKGGMIAKSTGFAAIAATFSALFGAILTLRANLDQARTPRERRAVVKITVWAFFGAHVFLAALFGLTVAARRSPDHRVLFAWCAQALVVSAAIVWPWLLLRAMRRIRALRTSERRASPEFFRDAIDQVGSESSEYKTAATLFGVPLVHVRFSTPEEGAPPVVAWIAGGDRAIGFVAAWGGIAIAPLSVGAVSFGLLSIGSLGVGVISMGTIAIGALGLGSVSVGFKAYAWLSALGWRTAQSSGFSVSHVAAEGPVALAPHANDLIARANLADANWGLHEALFFITISVLSLVPIILYASAVRRRFGRAARQDNL